MITRRCFLCSDRIGRKHVMQASYLDGRRHVVRLCYGCSFKGGLTPGLIESSAAVDAKLREIKALEV